jgi:hypothetical protein
MKKLFFRIIVFLLALVIGLLAASIGSRLYAARTEDRTLDLIAIIDLSIKATGSRFQETGRGCGMGYVQGYETDDGIKVSEGNIGCSAVGKENPFREAKRKPNRVITQTGERAVVEINEDGKRSFEIYEISEGDCTHFISAPTLELALEFEEFLKNRDK